MVDINCIKIKEYTNFKYKELSLRNIWKGYDDEDEDEIFMFFDLYYNNQLIETEDFCRATTKKNLILFIKNDLYPELEDRYFDFFDSLKNLE